MVGVGAQGEYTSVAVASVFEALDSHFVNRKCDVHSDPWGLDLVALCQRTEH